MAEVTDTPGRRRLARALDARLVTQQQVADATGASQPWVSAWKSGKARPYDAFHRFALDRLLGISPHAWFTAEERERLARLRRVHVARMRARTGARQMNARTRRGRSADRA